MHFSGPTTEAEFDPSSGTITLKLPFCTIGLEPGEAHDLAQELLNALDEAYPDSEDDDFTDENPDMPPEHSPNAVRAAEMDTTSMTVRVWTKGDITPTELSRSLRDMANRIDMEYSAAQGSA